MHEQPQRPALTPALTAEEFGRWYWLKDELAGFARVLGTRATGGKELLAAWRRYRDLPVDERGRA